MLPRQLWRLTEHPLSESEPWSSSPLSPDTRVRHYLYILYLMLITPIKICLPAPLFSEADLSLVWGER